MLLRGGGTCPKLGAMGVAAAMILAIADLLSAADLEAVRARLADAAFEDGGATAGWSARLGVRLDSDFPIAADVTDEASMAALFADLDPEARERLDEMFRVALARARA